MRRAVILACAIACAVPAQAAAAPAAKTSFNTKRAGEALLTLRASAPGTDWGREGSESAVVRVELDGRYNQDVVLFEGARAFDYAVSLGPVTRGHHTVTASFDRAKSPAGARGADVTALRPSLAADSLAQRYAPIVYGRDLPEIAGAYENNRTDVPLLTYHEQRSDGAGNTVLEYTVIWSNEDGGTNTPALMARWGRTTDIEWVYRVTLSPAGEVLSEVYQAPNHETLAYDGAKLGDHPMLETGTSNNNMLAVKDPQASTGYRFFPDIAATLPARRAREAVMDANPWTYQVMAKEMIREGKVEPVASPDTATMSDQRYYVFAEIDKDTAYAAPPPSGSWAGTALEAKVGGRWYSSHHGVPDWSIQRDDPAATTVELPPGTTAAQVEAVRAVAVPVGTPGEYRIDVRSLNRGFLLGEDFLPGASLETWSGDAVLTPASPSAVLWQR